MSKKRVVAGIYIHIPFCVSRCAYCDFFSTVPEGIPVKEAYGARIVKQLALELGTVRDGDLVSLYLGGGSPSTMPPSFFTALGAALRNAGIDASAIEFTVEANPADLSARMLDLFAAAGVNRLSLGVQAADDAVLSAMGRRATRTTLKKIVPLARERFGDLSYDIIYGFGKKDRDLTAELQWLFDIAAPDHLSAYCYTRPHRRGAPPVASEDTVVEEEAAIARFLTAHRFRRYEVSNWARRGFKSVHNRLYWSWDRYIGIGAGAHGFEPRDGIRYRYPDSVASFIRRPAPIVEQLPRETLMREFTMLGLRTAAGVSLAKFSRTFGISLSELLSPVTRERFLAAGFARLSATHLRATRAGLSFLNTLTAAIFDDIERHERDHAG